jgi:pimeloyl-ACP methyl ester carboxylesterase
MPTARLEEIELHYDDRVIPAASSDPLHEQIPNSRLQVVRGVGHLFFIEAPEETLTALSRFFHN